ncbi:hypothetical protein HOLleu_01917 [Holothuria leucospilota]|uniref:Uncharacterized protein n=1 Tax=Holothuria leucospilota TaxID=206669 RepID=A0A9Q1CPY5_HOLLE|nr:hypothetical protein HOLleu_01917 [Holothuria leucospilota]
MTISYIVHFLTRQQCLFITAFVLSFFFIASFYANGKYFQIHHLLQSHYLLGIFRNQKLSSKKSNANHPQVEIKTENDRNFTKLYDDYLTTSTDKEIPIIDLDKEDPPLNLLYEKLTLVTAFSENHFQEGPGFIGSAQQQMPNKTIILYDLGLKEHSANQVFDVLSFCF